MKYQADHIYHPLKKSAHAQNSRCPFCRPQIHNVVAAGDEWFAIANAAPRAPVSLLFIPRVHVTDLVDITPNRLSVLLGAVQHYIREHSADFKHGYRLVLNFGEDARQSQPHLHVQVLAGGANGYDLGHYCTAAGYPDLIYMQALSEKLKRLPGSAA